MEPSSTAFRTLLVTARQEPLSALVRLLDAEYMSLSDVARPECERILSLVGRET